MRFSRCLLLISVLTTVAAGTARGQDVEVTIANPDEIVASLPDTTLVKDVMGEVDRDLSIVAFHRGSDAPEPTDLVGELLRLAAPEAVQNLQLSITNGVAVFKLGPAPEFDAFLQAIDYGEVVASDASGRSVRVKIDVAELQRDKLMARAEAKGTAAADRLDKLLSGRKRARRPGFPSDKEPERVAGLAGLIEAGDYVEVSIGREPFNGTVEQIEPGSFGKEVALVRLLDKDKLAKALDKRSLRKRVAAAESFAFWAPLERLRKLPGAPTPAPEERTWTDSTGKFKVVATFDGLEGDRVRLKRSGGKVTEVPLTRLCEADRDYVRDLTSAAENPFAAPTTTAGASLRADWSGVQAIRTSQSRRWQWKPPAVFERAPAPGGPSRVDLDTPPGAKIEALYLAADGLSAIVHTEAGIGRDERVSLQFVDLKSGAAAGVVECPPNTKVLDARPEERLVVLSNDEDRDSPRLYLQKVGDGELDPVSDFDAAAPDNTFHDIKAARLLAGSRMLTCGLSGSAVIWDHSTAKALYSLDDLNGVSPTVAVGPTGKFLFAAVKGAIVVVDTERGQQVAAIPHTLTSIDSLSVGSRLRRVGVGSGESLAAVDLTTGDVSNGLLGMPRSAGVDFVGRMWFVDNRYLIDPRYPLLLWQYVMDTTNPYDNHAAVRGKRLWYAARTGRRDGATWSLASVDMPHDAVRQKLTEIGDPNDLVILQAGDRVEIVVDTDLDAARAEDLRKAATKAFQATGYEVVPGEGADPGVKQAVVTCKKAPEPIEVWIANPDKPKPADNPTAFKPPKGFYIPRMGSPGFGRLMSADWMYESHRITPYESSLSIRSGDDVLWTDGATVRAGAQFQPTAKGTVQDVLTRLTTPDVDRLLAIQIPEQMCKTGPIGGTFGASLLDADGVTRDLLDPKDLEE